MFYEQASAALEFATNFGDEGAASQLFGSYPLMAEEIYWAQIDEIISSRESLLLGVFEITSDYLNTIVPYFLKEPVNLKQTKVETDFLELRNRAAALGATVGIRERTIAVLPIEKVVNYMQEFAPDHVRTSIIERHHNELYQTYALDHNADAAGVHAAALFIARAHVTPAKLNNVGYYFLSQDRLLEAQIALEGATKGGPRPDLPLAQYNLAVARLKRGDALGAKSDLLAICRETDNRSDDQEAQCLLVPLAVDGKLIWQEEYKVNVLHTVRSTLKAIDSNQ